MKNIYNKIYQQDSRDMNQLPDNSVDLMVTSPPYNVTKKYDENLTLNEYLTLITDVNKEVFRVLKSGGILALNIANVGRKPYIPLDCSIIESLLNLGYIVRHEIIWNKAASAGGSCAWGSWKSASNPSLRDVHEYIIIAQKPPITNSIIKIKPESIKDFPEKLEDKIHAISTKEFFSDIWPFGTESATKVNHPAPFRVELPYRIIMMFTDESAIVLDPFIGSGTTAIASLLSNRKFVGYEINKEYIAIANRRIDEFLHPEKKKLRLKEERARKNAERKKKAKKKSSNNLPTKKNEKSDKLTDGMKKNRKVDKQTNLMSYGITLNMKDE